MFGPFKYQTCQVFRWLHYRSSSTCLILLFFKVSALVASGSYEGRSLLDTIVNLLARNRNVELQLSAARCLAYLHRCGVLTECDHRIIYKTLPCLVSGIFIHAELIVKWSMLNAQVLALERGLSYKTSKIRTHSKSECFQVRILDGSDLGWSVIAMELTFQYLNHSKSEQNGRHVFGFRMVARKLFFCLFLL